MTLEDSCFNLPLHAPSQASGIWFQGSASETEATWRRSKCTGIIVSSPPSVVSELWNDQHKTRHPSPPDSTSTLRIRSSKWVKLRAVVDTLSNLPASPAQNRSRANFDSHGSEPLLLRYTRPAALDWQWGGFGAVEKGHSAITMQYVFVTTAFLLVRRCNVATGFVSIAVSLLVLMTVHAADKPETPRDLNKNEHRHDIGSASSWADSKECIHRCWNTEASARPSRASCRTAQQSATEFDCTTAGRRGQPTGLGASFASA